MQKKEIINILNENELSDVEVLKSEDNLILINFYLDFDNDLIAAAKAYASEECKDKEGSESYLNEYYLPYLYDYANDEVLSIVEEITEEFEIAGEFMAFQIKEPYDYVQFMTLFTEENMEVSIEEVVKDYMS